MQLDLTRPNTGRMLDYWLGGNHNFEIDRQLAEQVAKSFPIVKGEAEEARMLVTLCVNDYHARGIHAFVDFGSGLPTCDNTHIVAQKLDPGARVVYSDIDPLTVAYGQELLRGTPNAIYLQADAAKPQTVLDSPMTRELLGEERRVGFVFLSLAHLMSDEQLRSAWRTLYDWAAPGSCLTISNASELWSTDPDLMTVTESYRRANIASFFRTPAQITQLLQPWKLTDAGIIPSTVWNMPRKEPQTRVLAYLATLYK